MGAYLQIKQSPVDKTDEVIRVLEEYKSQKDYRGGYLLTDHETGETMAIGLFKGEEGIASTKQRGVYREMLSEVASFLATTPTPDVYQVSDQE